MPNAPETQGKNGKKKKNRISRSVLKMWRLTIELRNKRKEYEWIWVWWKRKVLLGGVIYLEIRHLFAVCDNENVATRVQKSLTQCFLSNRNTYGVIAVSRSIKIFRSREESCHKWGKFSLGGVCIEPVKPERVDQQRSGRSLFYK